ncbi:hypothetical protein [Arthrobacter oryzae]|uniref:protein-tyrosine-phosphatase n=1 Tax=Arthrobacter oryzae TaxID=409290 RepID=A0A3N0BZU5_9MICC|nr:hypothetical protein [Arthrobacter oryzae]RNL55437.1 hypothetical protein D7003_09915 [Arthrobacter oryzae]
MAAILVICTGNVCRSPLAEAVLREKLLLSGVSVSSAGTAAAPAAPMCPRALAAAPKSGERTGAHHRSRLLTAQQLEDADLVLVAAFEHRTAVARLQPGARRKTFTLKEAAAFIQGMADERLPDRVGATGAVATAAGIGALAREMNDLRGTGMLPAEVRRINLFPRRAAASSSQFEVADGHWGTARAHRKTLGEIARASHVVGGALAGLLRVPG